VNRSSGSGTSSSAISFAAVFYGEDIDGVVRVTEADAVVADTETELWGFDITKPLDVAFAGSNDAGQSVENAQGCGWLEGWPWPGRSKRSFSP
jgi:hypothetical protein